MARAKAKGFTLIETMIAVLVAAIFLMVAVPAYYSMVQNNKVVAVSNKLAATFNYARMEAIRRGQAVVVCPAASPALNSCGNAGQWPEGWVIFLDRNNNNTFDANDEIMRVHESLPSGMNVATGASFAAYDGTGFLSSGPFQMLISADGCDRDNARIFELSATGRLSITRTACP